MRREAAPGCVVAMGVGLALLLGQGCKKQPARAPVEPVVRRAPRVRPDFPVGSLPPAVDTSVPRGDQGVRRRPQVQTPQIQNGDALAAEAAAAERRQQDARLLQQQRTASESQQRELDQEIQQSVKTQQTVQAEPRVQDSAGPGLPPPPVQPRIQDTLPAPAQPVPPQ